MATIISAGTTTSTALNMSADTSGVLQLASNNGQTAMTVNTDQSVVFAQAASLPNTFGFKNRIINGAMVIDQRNVGASGTATNVFTVDRWSFTGTQISKATWGQNLNSVTAPTGFKNYLGIQSSSAYSVLSTDIFTLQQPIEGFNVADLAWGTASAATVTLSFRVYSSLTGTFGGSLTNATPNRSYPFTYTVSSANTWTTISITVPGDTTGTWATDNSQGLRVYFGLGVGSTYSGTAGAWAGADYRSATGATSVVGTSGATFYITGVQLEKGSTATPFDYRPYGTELALCQRYFEKSYDVDVAPGSITALRSFRATCQATTQYMSINTQFAVRKRATPTVTAYNPNTGATGQFVADSTTVSVISVTDSAGLVVYANNVTTTVNQFFNGHWTASAEL